MRINVGIEIPDEIVSNALNADDLDRALIPFQSHVGVDGGMASIFFNEEDEALWKDPTSKNGGRRLARFLEYVDHELTGTLEKVVADNRLLWNEEEEAQAYAARTS